MSTLKDLLHLLAVHGILCHLLHRVLLPMALQAALRGLIVQVITCPNSPSN